MGLRIHKKGQGYWTRVMSAIALGTLVLMGAAWLWDNFKNVRLGGSDEIDPATKALVDPGLEPVYTQAGVAVIFVGFFALLGYYLIGCKPKVVDFLIATEGEMKKVNWSTRREIRGSTIVVIGLTFIVAVIIGVLDLAYLKIFQWITVLDA